MMNQIHVQRLDHIALDVSDVSAARSFYGGLLGLKEVPRPESFDFPGLWYELGNAMLHIVAPRQPAIGKHHIALWVDDVHASADVLTHAGYEVDWERTKIPGIDRYFTRDADGNLIEIQGREQAP